MTYALALACLVLGVVIGMTAMKWAFDMGRDHQRVLDCSFTKGSYRNDVCWSSN